MGVFYQDTKTGKWISVADDLTYQVTSSINRAIFWLEQTDGYANQVHPPILYSGRFTRTSITEPAPEMTPAETNLESYFQQFPEQDTPRRGYGRGGRQPSLPKEVLQNVRAGKQGVSPFFAEGMADGGDIRPRVTYTPYLDPFADTDEEVPGQRPSPTPLAKPAAVPGEPSSAMPLSAGHIPMIATEGLDPDALRLAVGRPTEGLPKVDDPARGTSAVRLPVPVPEFEPYTLPTDQNPWVQLLNIIDELKGPISAASLAGFTEDAAKLLTEAPTVLGGGIDELTFVKIQDFLIRKSNAVAYAYEDTAVGREGVRAQNTIRRAREEAAVILERIKSGEWLEEMRDLAQKGIDARTIAERDKTFAIIDETFELMMNRAVAEGNGPRIDELNAIKVQISARMPDWKNAYMDFFEERTLGFDLTGDDVKRFKEFQTDGPLEFLQGLIIGEYTTGTGDLVDVPIMLSVLEDMGGLTASQLSEQLIASLTRRAAQVSQQNSLREQYRTALESEITNYNAYGADPDYDGDPKAKEAFRNVAIALQAALDNADKENSLIEQGLSGLDFITETNNFITATVRRSLSGNPHLTKAIRDGDPAVTYALLGSAAVEVSNDKAAYRANLATTAEQFRTWSLSSDFAGNPELQDAFLSIAQSLEARSAPGSQVSLKGLDSDIISETDTLKVIKDLLKPFPTYANMITDGQLALSLETIRAATVPDPRVEAAKLAEGEEDKYRASINATAGQFRTWAGSAAYAGNPKLQAAFLSIAQSLEAKGLPGSTVDLQGRDADTVSQEDALAALKEGLAGFPQYLERNLVEGQLQATLQLMEAETARLPGQEEEEFVRQELEEIERARLEAAAEDVRLFDQQGIVTVRDASGRIVSRDAAPGDRQQVKADRAAKTQSLLPDFLGKLGLSAQDIEAALNKGFTGEPDETPPGTAFMASLTSGEIEFDASAKTMIAKLSPRLGEVTGIARNVGYSEEEINTLAEQVAKATEGEYGDVPGTIREQLDIVTARDVELDDLAMDLEEEFVGLTGGGGELNALLGSLRARRAKAQEEGDLGIVQELTKNIQFIQKNMPTPAGKPQQTGVTVSTTAMGQPIAGTERQFVTAEAARQRPATPLAMARQQIVERQQQGLDPYSFSPEEIEARVMRDAAAQDRTAQLSEIQAAQANELERQQRIGARAQARADYQAAALKPEKKKQPTANLQGRRVSR